MRAGPDALLGRPSVRSGRAVVPVADQREERRLVRLLREVRAALSEVHGGTFPGSVDHRVSIGRLPCRSSGTAPGAGLPMSFNVRANESVAPSVGGEAAPPPVSAPAGVKPV